MGTRIETDRVEGVNEYAWTLHCLKYDDHDNLPSFRTCVRQSLLSSTQSHICNEIGKADFKSAVKTLALKGSHRCVLGNVSGVTAWRRASKKIAQYNARFSPSLMMLSGRSLIFV